jgi:hypothetical protein
MGRRKKPTADELRACCEAIRDATRGACETEEGGCFGIGWCREATEDARKALEAGHGDE